MQFKYCDVLRTTRADKYPYFNKRLEQILHVENNTQYKTHRSLVTRDHENTQQPMLTLMTVEQNLLTFSKHVEDHATGIYAGYCRPMPPPLPLPETR